MFGSSRNGLLGVDVGAGLVKAAQLRRTPTGFSVVAAAIPRSTDALASPLEQRVTEIKALRSLAPKLRGVDGAALISMRDCELSALGQDDPSLGYAEQAPRATDQWGDESGGYQLSTTLSEVEAVCDGFDRIGLRCTTVDGTPTALARALQLIPDYRPDELVMGFDWGASSATLVGAKAGVARYARRLKVAGFDEVIQEVAEQLALAKQDADRAIARYGVSAEQSAGAIVSKALRAALSTLPGELRRTLSHLEGKLKARAPSRWVIFGAAATTPGLPRMLEESLRVRVEPWTAAGVEIDEASNAPICLFGPAVALSALRWEDAS